MCKEGDSLLEECKGEYQHEECQEGTVVLGGMHIKVNTTVMGQEECKQHGVLMLELEEGSYRGELQEEP